MKKLKRVLFILFVGIASVALGIYSYVSRNRYWIAIEHGFISTDRSLHLAVANGDKDAVMRLIEKGFDVNNKDELGQPPLIVASGGSVFGVGPPARIDTNVAEFLTAVGVIKTDMAEMLIALGADVNARCGSWWLRGGGLPEMVGQTPLHNAASLQMARLLVESGADVNARDKHGETALHRMIAFEDVARLLIANGADVNAEDKDGMLVLDYAVMTDLVELLIAKGATPTVHSTAWMGESAKLEALLEKGADVDAKTKYGLTPLHLVSFQGDEELVKLLLAKEASVDVKAELGLTPLHMAALTGHRGVAELLIAQGAQIDTQSDFGWTPLLLAKSKGHTQLIELLSNNGADANLMVRSLADSYHFVYTYDWRRGIWLKVMEGHAGPIPKALAEQLVVKGSKD